MTKILVIDDEVIIRERLSKLLKLDGYEVVTAENGLQGLEIVKVQRPEVALVDVKMPGMDGLEVLKEIKKIHKQTEVIIITGHGGIKSAILALRQGAFDYIAKPVDYDELEISIKRALEKQQMQRKLDEHVDHLEEMVEERTQSLKDTQAQLIQSEKMAVVGQFAAGIGHEINNPLTRITMNTEMILGKEHLDEKIRKKIQVIGESADRIAAIVKELLTFSRKQGKEDLQIININSLIERSLKLVEHQMALNNIEVIKEFGRDMPNINVVPNQMEQIFINLITNAFQAMPVGGKLWVATKKNVWTENDRIDHVRRRTDDPGLININDEIIVITISDTGNGISEENLAKIFMPFFTTKEAGKGTGLGLSLVYTLVKGHGGKIDVKSKAGKGTTVIIKLPVKGEKKDG